MPRKRLQSKRRRVSLLDEFDLYLTCKRYGNFEDTETQRAELESTRDSWEPWADQIITATAARHPGCRPSFWWHFDCPEQHRHMGEHFPYTLEHFRERLRLLESMGALFDGERESLRGWIEERKQHHAASA
jgi:hypothetical protein